MKPIRHYLHNHIPPNLLLHVASVSKIIHFWNYIIFQRSWRVRRILDKVLSNLQEGDHVLDAGCGDGQHLLYIANRFACLNIHGIDIAKGNIELLNSYISNHKLNNVFRSLHPSLQSLQSRSIGPGETVSNMVGTEIFQSACFFNGKEIVKKINSLGYLLGDEGSGYALGRSFLKKYFRNQLPDNISDSFRNNYI